jgi:hypothetical protein
MIFLRVVPTSQIAEPVEKVAGAGVTEQVRECNMQP